MKYGIIYLWYDKKHKRYYLGSHWGTENDGYICSSNWMNKSYKRRPHDFKRKIILRIFSNRKDLLEEEYKCLSMIKKEELGKKYYNFTNHKNGHWFTEEKSLDIKEKISQKTKESMWNPEIRQKYIKGLETRNTHSSDLEVREKRRQSMIGKNKGKITVKDKDGNIFHVTHNDLRWINGEVVAASKGVKRSSLTESHKNKIKETTVFKNINTKKIKCIYCNFEGNIGNISRYHNEKCKNKL